MSRRSDWIDRRQYDVSRMRDALDVLESDLDELETLLEDNPLEFRDAMAELDLHQLDEIEGGYCDFVEGADGGWDT